MMSDSWGIDHKSSACGAISPPALRAKAAEIDGMIDGPADAPDPSVLHGYIKAAAIGAQDTCRMHPGIGFPLDTEIDVEPGLQ